MMEGGSDVLADRLKTHLHCQSFAQNVVRLRGHKQMGNEDRFAVERTAWLVEELVCLRDDVGQMLLDVSAALAELQSEEIGLRSLSLAHIALS